MVSERASRFLTRARAHIIASHTVGSAFPAATRYILATSAMTRRRIISTNGRIAWFAAGAAGSRTMPSRRALSAGALSSGKGGRASGREVRVPVTRLR